MSEHVMIDIRPADVTRAFVRRSSGAKLAFALNGLGRPTAIRGGGWDRRTIPIESHPTYQLMRTLAELGFEPERCFDALSTYFRDKGRTEERARTMARARLRDYVLEYKSLYEGMRDHGYLSGLAEDDIGIAIDRDGAIIKVPNGNHRFYSAVVLGMSQVPAEIRFVHAAWYRRNTRGLRGSVMARICGALQWDGWIGCRMIERREE